MNIDVNELKKITQQSINNQLEEQIRKAEIKRLEEEARRQVEISKANEVISRVPSRLENAARDGKYSVGIMNINYGDYDGQEPSEYNLHLAPSLVYKFLKENNLNPYFYYDHDGVGIKSWYVLTVTWKD